MQVVFRKDPIVPSVEGMQNLQNNVDYWGDRCCKAEAEIERLRGCLGAIMTATVEGRVCDDVAWFDGITTLFDFCDMALNPDEPS